MAQLHVKELKLDFGRDYQPLTEGPGGGYFSFQALNGAGGKRIAAVAYLIPAGKKGEYRVETDNKQSGKGRLSAYNESLAQTVERELIQRLRYDLLRQGWRETVTGRWVSPEAAIHAEEDELVPFPANLEDEAPAPLVPTEAAPDGVQATVSKILSSAENLDPNAVVMVALPNDVYMVVMHGTKFAGLMEMIARSPAE